MRLTLIQNRIYYQVQIQRKKKNQNLIKEKKKHLTKNGNITEFVQVN